jgi:hypothetical protein
VAEFVTKCINQLGGQPGPQTNALPLGEGSGYVLPARTADEIRQTPAANTGHVSRAPRRYQTMDSVETVAQRGELADPVQGQPEPQQPQRRIILPNDPWAL